MNIKNGYYIAKCTSENVPEFRLDSGTFYLPIGVVHDETDGLYHYDEYRFNLPVDYNMPREVYGLLCNALVNYMGYYKQLEERQTATEDAILEIAEIIGGGTDG